jgi:hypothetical protein
MLQFMWSSSDGDWPAKDNFKHCINAVRSGNIAMLDWLVEQELFTEVDPDKESHEEYQAKNIAVVADLQQYGLSYPGLLASLQADPNSPRFNQGQGELYTAAVLGCSTQVRSNCITHFAHHQCCHYCTHSVAPRV